MIKLAPNELRYLLGRDIEATQYEAELDLCAEENDNLGVQLEIKSEIINQSEKIINAEKQEKTMISDENEKEKKQNKKLLRQNKVLKFGIVGALISSTGSLFVAIVK